MAICGSPPCVRSVTVPQRDFRSGPDHPAKRMRSSQDGGTVLAGGGPIRSLRMPFDTPQNKTDLGTTVCCPHHSKKKLALRRYP